MIYLSDNENTLIKHDFKEIFKNDELLCRYPCDNEYLLKQKLAQIHGVKEENITLGCGSSDIIQRVIIALSHKANARGKKLNLIVPMPTFDLVLSITKALDIDIDYIYVDESFKLDINKIAPKKDTINLLYITNPNNPSARELSKEELDKLCSMCGGDFYMILDEAYAEYSDDFISIKKAHYDNIIITRTFSKIYALAGLRIGYAIAKSEFLSVIDKFIMLDNINAYGLFCALYVLDNDDLNMIKNLTRQNRLKIQKVFDELNIDYIPSKVNFILHKIKDVKYRDFMLEHGVKVGRVINNFPLYNRIAVGNDTELEAFFKALQKAKNQGLV